METRHPLRFAIGFIVVCGMGIVASAQTLSPECAEMPDGVSVQASSGGGFKVLSIASAPCKEDTPAALSAARTVATAKAKAALSRFLDETVSVNEFLERESTRVRTEDGALAKTDVRRTLVRIKTESHALLRGVKELGAHYSPAPGGGGTLRLAVGVDSSCLADAEAMKSAMQAPENRKTFGN